MNVKIAMFVPPSKYERLTLAAARSSPIECLHSDDMLADRRHARCRTPLAPTAATVSEAARPYRLAPARARRLTFKTKKVMIDAASRLNEEFPLIKLPVLILHGTEDKATNPSGSQFFYDNAGSTDKTLKLYEGHYHDLLNDVDKDVVMADINDWIDARVPAIQTQSAAV